MSNLDMEYARKEAEDYISNYMVTTAWFEGNCSKNAGNRRSFKWAPIRTGSGSLEGAAPHHSRLVESPEEFQQQIPYASFIEAR